MTSPSWHHYGAVAWFALWSALALWLAIRHGGGPNWWMLLFGWQAFNLIFAAGKLTAHIQHKHRTRKTPQ